jgi:exosortase
MDGPATDRRIEPLFWNERWRLAALPRQELACIGLVSVIVGMAYLVFHFLGNTSHVEIFGRSTLGWMLHRWQDSSISFNSTDYSHGFLIPVVSLAAVWWRRRELLEADKQVSRLGLVCLIGALALHWLGAKAQHPRLSLLAMIGLFWSIPYYLHGRQVARLLLFPCTYLIFCVPLGFLDELTQPLQLMMVRLSTGLLNGLGLPVETGGTQIRMLHSGGVFDVAAPCSGLRSLLALTALTAAYAYFTQPTVIRAWILFSLSIPLAIAGNMARVVSIVLVAEVAGSEFALGVYHDYAGFLVFGVGIALMAAAGNVLESDPKEWIAKWKAALSGPTWSPSS